jgi:hypothetical protein
MIESCKKDGSGELVNTIKITDGEFSGFSHTFTPNLGFWSSATETTRYMHLVLGDIDNQVTTGENIMSILFYDTGVQFIDINDSSRKISFTMHLSLPMQEI